MSDHWILLKLEGYCGYGWDSRLHESYMQVDDWDEWIISEHPNPEYDPTYTEERPSYCPVDPPSIVCLDNHCPYFAYCEADDEKERDV